jgi:tetratricopeptide (TPR) repeat protein
VLSLLGAAQLELGLAADAAVTLRRRGRLAPEDARAWVLLATAEQQAGRSEEAAQAAARAVEAAPEWSGAQIAAAEVALAAGRLDDARAHAERAAALSKDPSAARLVTAKVELASGDKAAAGRRLGELVESGAASREAYTLLGRLRLEGGDLAGAEAVYARMLERYPNDAVAAREAGVFYGYQRRYAEAADHFERALSLRPGDREALRQLAWAEIQGGRSERGLDHARQLVAAAPTPENRFVLASALERSGQLEAAAQTYQEVIQESPEHFGAIASLSLLRAREERWAEAKKLARRAAALLPAGSPSLQPLQPILDRPD